MDKDRARTEIAALVDNFQALSATQKRQYTEEDVKKDFLLPLFRALGWDVENTQKLNEVRAEEKIADGYPDYSFRLNGVPVFFLEAKKFSVDIATKAPMQQAINYSYLKGVTWAVLSDFEGVMVFNADWEERDPLKARMLDLHWDHYTSDQFDDLWLLSKPAIEAGEIDKKAERYGRKKKRDDVNKVLFADLTQWRRELFNEITQMGGTIFQNQNYRMVDDAIQRLLDRLIFIRTIEDRRVEENRLRATLRQYTERKGKKGSLFADLLDLFRELDDVYNARLFAYAPLDRDVEIHDVILLEKIINGLYDVKGNFANYDFAAIDADVLGAVYEQYLSFKAQDPEGKDEIDLSKRSKRKAQGIYYTPKYVVRYIVQQTLGRLLSDPDMTPEKAHKLRILDPACGSGSFLIEAFQVLDRWLAENGDESDRKFPRQRQMRILQENLYGVDLDPQAVEVARLNLLLQAAHQREKLPMLHNIKYGNSLISDPDVAGDAAFDWDKAFPDMMASGGFDVVIGNPPYGATTSINENNYFRTRFGDAGTTDTYELFLLLASQVLKENSEVGMIIPSSWLTGESYTASRKFLLNLMSPKVAYALPFDVFPGAYIDTAIVVFALNSQNENICLIHYFPKKEKLFDIPVNIGVRVPVEQIKSDKLYRFSVMLSKEYKPIVDKLDLCETRFGNLFDIQRGIQPYSRSMHTEEQIKAKFLHSTTKETDKHLPELQGEELSRYYVAPERVSYIELSERVASARSISMFEGSRIVLRRLLTRQFRLQASYAQETMITTDNVLNMVPKTSDVDVLFCVGLINSNIISWYYTGTSMIAQKDDFPQTTISSLKALPIPATDTVNRKKLASMVARMLQLRQDHAAAEESLSDRRHELADQIARLDAQIDALVYELYGLTDEEIAIVEG